MSGAGKDRISSDPFRKAIESADPLRWKAGLQALKKSEGGERIAAEDSRKLLGGSTVDDDCKAAYPNANRWDYVLGYQREAEAVAYFIEVHSANASGVTELGKKLEWLRLFLQEGPRAELAKLSCEYHWVASGNIKIPENTPQYKFLNTSLRKKGIRGPVKHLTLA